MMSSIGNSCKQALGASTTRSGDHGSSSTAMMRRRSGAPAGGTLSFTLQSVVQGKKEVPGRMAQMTKPRTPNSEARQQLGRLLDALAKEALDTPDEAFFAELTSEKFSF